MRSPENVSSEDLDALSEQLQEDHDHLLVVGHHPLTDIGCAWLDAHRVVNGEAVVGLLESCPASRAYLCGHIHQEYDRIHNGIRYLATPSTCWQFAPDSDSFGFDDSPPGWRWLELHDDGNYSHGSVQAPMSLDLEDETLKKKYTTESIVVLEGLDPVRRRPGMYTDLTRPNHLIQEVVDNSVDEVLEGFGSQIDVELQPDGTISVSDQGRGMPVDVHPVHKICGIELIMTTLHAGAKFDSESYRFAGGLHGVGVSVVNALSLWLEVEVRQNGNVYFQRFENGISQGPLAITSSVGKKTTGTTITFLPDASFFDSGQVSVSRLRHVLRAKSILCSGLRMNLVMFDGDGKETGGELDLREWLSWLPLREHQG